MLTQLITLVRLLTYTQLIFRDIRKAGSLRGADLWHAISESAVSRRDLPNLPSGGYEQTAHSHPDDHLWEDFARARRSSKVVVSSTQDSPVQEEDNNQKELPLK